jgi:hypothetical protein
VRLALDNHYSPDIAAKLRAKRHDAVAIIERGWQTEDDERVLELCHAEHRALMTNNVADFAVIARRWMVEARPHAGLIFTSDASMPRNRATTGRFVEALDKLFRADRADDALRDRVIWL